jgi:hypothetical protein
MTFGSMGVVDMLLLEMARREEPVGFVSPGVT